MVKSVDSMKAYRRAKKATATSNISAKTAEGESSQVPPKKPTSSASGPRKVIHTPQVHLVDPPQTSAATSSPTVVLLQKDKGLLSLSIWMPLTLMLLGLLINKLLLMVLFLLTMYPFLSFGLHYPKQY